MHCQQGEGQGTLAHAKVHGSLCWANGPTTEPGALSNQVAAAMHVCLHVRRLFFDALQLWLILVGPQYGYTGWIDQDNK